MGVGGVGGMLNLSIGSVPMVEVGKFVGCLQSCGIGYFAGVPDLLLKIFCAHVSGK